MYYSRYILVQIVFLFLPLNVYGAFGDFVQAPANGAVTSSGNSLPLAFASNVTAGNTIFVAVRTAAGRTITIADTLTHTYSLESQQDGCGGQVAIYRVSNISGGANTVTASIDGTATSIRMVILEVSGKAEKDGSAAIATGTSATPSSGNFTASISTPLLIGVVCNSANNTITAGTDWTLRAVAGAAGVSRIAIEMRQPGASGTYAATFNMTSDLFVAVGQSYKEITSSTIKNLTMMGIGD